MCALNIAKITKIVRVVHMLSMTRNKLGQFCRVDCGDEKKKKNSCIVYLTRADVVVFNN